MNRNLITLTSCACIVVLMASCTRSEFSCKSKDSNFSLAKREKRDVIDFAKIEKKIIPETFAMRNEKDRGFAGFDDPTIFGGAVSLATEGVKALIAMDSKKYKASYSDAKTDLYFYDQLSLKGPFDPLGMQFNGFTVVRTFVNKQGRTDTALYAVFEPELGNPSEIINNSFFRLKVKDIFVRYAEAKVPKARWYLPWTLHQSDRDEQLNMDLEVIFKTSYIDKNGQLNADVVLGTFILTLRDIPLNPKDPKYNTFFDGIKDQPLTGKSFIVPRSLGTFYNQEGDLKQCFSQGEYNITVNVNESAKDKFVNKLIQDNSDIIVDKASNVVGTGGSQILFKER